LVYLLPTIFTWLSNILILMKVISEARRVYYIKYLRFYSYHWVDTSTNGLLVPDGIIRPIAVLRHWLGLFDIFITEMYSS